MKLRWIGLVLALLLASSASAYIAPTTYLLQRFIQARIERQIFGLKVVMRSSLREGSQRIEGTRTLHLAAPWRARSELETDQGTTLRVRDGSREWLQRPGQAGKRQKRSLDLIADFFSAAEQGKEESSEARDRLLRILKGLKIDVSKTSLTRFDGRIAILVGAEPWDKLTPQIWLDKDGRFPLRFIYRDGPDEGAPLVDIRLLGFGSAKTGTIFPEVIEVYRDGGLVQRHVVEELEVLSKPKASLFTIP